MSAEVILISVGLLLVILAAIDSLTTRDLLNVNVRIPVGFLGVLLIVYGGYSFGNTNPQTPIEQVQVGNKAQIKLPVKDIQILSPIDLDSVQCRILTMGVYPEGHEGDIWVVLKPTDNRYYPQSDHTNTSYKRNGEWQVITRFGGDKGESYEIIVYETDDSASDYFSSAIYAWKEANSYPGLREEQIPDGAVEVDRFTVFLKESCRGVF